jgi:hypothetical protein
MTSFVHKLPSLPNMSQNPYNAVFSGEKPFNEEDIDGDRLLRDPLLKEALLSMARWQSFLVTLGFLVLSLTGVLVFASFFVKVSQGQSDIELSMTLIGGIVGLVLYGLPVFKLFRAAANLRACVLHSTSLTDAMRAQRAFWRATGIIVAIVIVLYILASMGTMIVSTGFVLP